MSKQLFQQVQQTIAIAEPAAKVQATRQLWNDWHNGELRISHDTALEAIQVPPMPDGLTLVAPAKLKKRGLHSPEALAAMIHAIAHIEYNAINLALDAVYRFRHLPCAYYHDWLSIAWEEAKHFELVWDYLKKLGYAYGDFPAHTGLWDMASRTSHDPMLRMALVPRVLEARGLDATPAIIERFRQAGDIEFVAILEVIQREEVGHVAAGSWWFSYLCEQRGLPPQQSFEKIFREHTQSRVKLPLARDARLEAGFSEQEIAYLEGFGF